MKFLLLFLCLPCFADIYLSIGHTEKLQAPQNARIYVANSKIVKLRDLGSEVLVTGKSLGETIIRIGNSSKNVVVLPKRLFGFFQEISKWAMNKSHISLQIKNSCLSVKAHYLVDIELEELAAIASHYKKPKNCQQKWALILADRMSQEQLEGYLLKKLKTMGYLEMNYFWLPQARVQVSFSLKQSPAIKQKLQNYGFLIEENMQAVGIVPMVEIEILVLEFRKKYFQKIGLQWPGSYSIQKSSTIDDFSLTLHALEENGIAKILASPKLLTQSEKEASFLAGGEIPIRVNGFSTSNLVWKEYGIRLKVLPKVDTRGYLQVSIETEVSMLDSSQTVDGVPGLLSNRFSTHFNLKKEKSIVLSGLIKQEWGQSSEGLPFLQRIPILGKLFSSEEYRSNQTELILIVRPKIFKEHTDV